MKAARVLGAFSFIGYAIVEELLRRDVHVYGYHPSHDLTLVEEEKWLLIGRNANFESVASLEEGKEVDVTYCCLDEPSHPLEESELKRAKEIIAQHVTGRIVLVSTIMANQEEFARFAELEMYVQEEIASHTIVKVPTVYGPWQPTYMTYHRLLEGRNVREAFYPMEACMDALYIDDVARVIVDSQWKGKRYFGSASGNQWREGFEALCEESSTYNQQWENAVESLEKEVITSLLSMEEGLQKQREHQNKFQHLFKDK